MAFFIRSNFHHPASCKGFTTEKECALTFDDGPDPDHTPPIIQILNRENIPATFFVVGNKLHGNETLIQEMDAAGHLIGNHSWSHSVWFDFFPLRTMKWELENTSNAIFDIIGKMPLLFRPPYGVINPTLSATLKKMAFQVIGWNIRSYDTIRHDQKKTADTILKGLSPGSIILLHDTLPGSAQLLEEVIAKLKYEGYAIVPLTQILHNEAYA